MRVVITGGAGFIGSRLTDRLLARGDDVTVVDVAASGALDGRLVRASVLDSEAMIEAFEGADVVVHLAGHVREEIRRRPYDGAGLQLQGTLNVLEACRRNRVPHLAFASSFYVYDGIASSEVVDEETVLDPRRMELFGSAKLMGEALCREYTGLYGFTHTIFRFGPAYGAGGSSAVTEFVETGLRNTPIEIWGRGERRNQYTYVDDLAAGVVAGLACENETFNLVSPESVSLAELGKLLADELGFAVRFDETRSEGPSFPYIAAEKAIRVLDWRTTDLRDGVRLTAREVAEAGDMALD